MSAQPQSLPDYTPQGNHLDHIDLSLVYGLLAEYKKVLATLHEHSAQTQELLKAMEDEQQREK